jgi:dihydrodipicolinate synthase/N-acetylneuraminate lyase
MKSALKLMGVLDSDTVSRPLRPMSEPEKEGLSDILQELGLANGAKGGW